MVEMKEKCVVILSGGPDSVTTLYWAKAQGYDVHSITFDYGQKAKIEIEYARKNAEKLKIPHKIIDLNNLNEIYQGVTSLVDTKIDINSGFSTPIIVPFRNGIFLAVTIAYAEGIETNTILYGAHASDEQYYPDCRKEFYKAFEKAARLGTEKPIKIKAPFSEIPKSSIITKAVDLGVPLELTWSCYLDGPIHCGECESCNNRKQAFKIAKIKDPTRYQKKG
jgi:7-cyano-7-deazaguanine synthase